MIYLDHAATTMPKPRQVSDAVVWAMQHTGSLGRGGHSAALLASETAYQCRALAGEMFELPAEQVVFTFNTTHGLNIAIRSVVSTGDEVVISGFEHNAVLRPLHALKAKILIAGRKLFDPLDTVQEFKNAITPNTKAVICTHVSNVFGYILPIEEISELCRERNIPLIIDAAQSAGILPVSVKRLHAAFIALPGHKGLFGPQGTGLLLCGAMPKPLLFGGTGSLSASMDMPDELPDLAEAGTQNIHGIAGLYEGMKIVRAISPQKIMAHEKTLIDVLAGALKSDSLQVFYGGPIVQSGVLSVVPLYMRCEALAEELYAAGFAVRTGYHCAPLAHKSAGTLDTGTVRLSVSAFTKQEETERLLDFFHSRKLL